MAENTIRETIAAKAQELGFDAFAVATPQLPAGTAENLTAFLNEGRHGEMDWMAERTAWRSDPRALWGDTRSILVLGLNYGPENDPLATLGERSKGNISVYARNRDYHDLVKKRLKALGRWLVGEYGCEIKVFVDTAPVMEKPLAMTGGIGWQGKHTNLVSKTFGSWLFLGEIFTTLDIPTDAPESDHCGDCRACLDICPTGALPAPYQIEPRRCISYLTIEHKGPIPRDLRAAMGNHIYGCDDCLSVCPWNKFAQPTAVDALQERTDLTAPPLAELAMLDDAAFRTFFSGSPIKRIGRDRFLRNVLIAIGNSKEPELIQSALACLDDSSPLVRGAAVWALVRLLEGKEFETLSLKHLEHESDASVRAEWET